MLQEFLNNNEFHNPSDNNSELYNKTEYAGDMEIYTAFNVLIGGFVCIGLYQCIYKIKPKIINYIKYKRHNKSLHNYLLLHETNEIYNLDQECTICLDNFISDQSIIKLDCNHIYHNECIQEWFKKELTCPNCRTNLEI